MKEDKTNKGFSNRIVTIAFALIGCVPVIVITFLLIGGFFVIGCGDELYAKELDNPYVNCGFDGWHTEDTAYGSIILPKDWSLTAESETMQILQNGESIAAGTLINGGDSSFSSKEAFLGQMLKTEVSKAHFDNLHSLLGSSFGKLYINENKEFQGYYLNLVNNDGSSLFFCFSSENQTESELKSKAEAIIYDHKYGENSASE